MYRTNLRIQLIPHRLCHYYRQAIATALLSLLILHGYVKSPRVSSFALQILYLLVISRGHMMCTKNIWLQDIHYIRLNYEPNRPLILGGSWKWQHSANICNNQLQKFVWSVPEVSMLIFLWYMYTWYVHVYIHCIPLKMVTRGALGKEHSTINYRSGTWDSTTYCLVLVSWSEKYTSESMCAKNLPSLGMYCKGNTKHWKRIL